MNPSTEKFKQTDIGLIPSDWEVDYIKNVAIIKTGSRNTQDRIEDGEYPFFVRSQTVERINSYSFDGEAVLTAGDGVGVGKVIHYVNGKFDCHQRVYRITDFTEKLNGYFFYLYFLNNFLNRIMQMTAKSSVDSVRMEMIANMLIPLPPTKAEQTAIANALSDADNYISGLEKLIAKKRLIKQAAMQKLIVNCELLIVNDKNEGSQLKKGWVVKKLGEICFPSKLRINPITSSENYRCVELEHLSQGSGQLLGYANSKDLLSHKSLFEKGDVLFGKLRPYLRKFLFADFDGVCTTEIWVLKPEKDVFNKFLFHLIQSEKVIEAANLSTGTKMPRAEWKIVSETEIAIPPFAEQIEIAEILSEMDAEIAKIEKQSAKAESIKQGMMQQLLTGKVRLIVTG